MPATFSAQDVANAYGLSLAPVAAGIQRGQQQQYIQQQLAEQRENKRIAEQDRTLNMAEKMFSAVNLATGTGADPLAAAELKAVQDDLVKYLKTYKGGSLYVDAYEQAAPRVAAIAARQDAAGKLKANVDATLTEYSKRYGFFDTAKLRADVLKNAIFDENNKVRPVIDPGQDYVSPIISDPSKASKYVDPTLARKSLAEGLNAQDPEERVEAFVMELGGSKIPQEVRYSARPFQSLTPDRRSVALAQDDTLPVAALRASDLATLSQRPEFAYLAQSTLQNIEQQVAANPTSDYARKWAGLDDEQKVRAAGYTVLKQLGPLKGTRVDAAKTPDAYNEYQQERRHREQQSQQAFSNNIALSRLRHDASSSDSSQAKKLQKAWGTPLGAMLTAVYTDPKTEAGVKARTALPRVQMPATVVNPKAHLLHAKGGVVGMVAKAGTIPTVPVYNLTAMNEGKLIDDPRTSTPSQVFFTEFGEGGKPSLIYQPMKKDIVSGAYIPDTDAGRRTVSGDAFFNEISTLAPALGVSTADFRDLFLPYLKK